MILAYVMYAPDGGSYFFDEANDSVFCSHCGSCIDREFLPKNLEFRRTSYEVFFTYDGRLIVSNRFREFCLENQIDGAEFKPVNEEGSLFHLSSSRKIKFDSERRKTRFEDFCEHCGQYESVTGAMPPFLLGVNQPLEHGFFRSNVEFGSGLEKHPLLFVGVKTKKILEEAQFKRVEFVEAAA